MSCPSTYQSNPPQTGFTIVEMMVALLIGLLLSGAVIQVYLSNKQSYNTQIGMSELQQSGRLAVVFLNSTLRLAGYRSDPASEEADVFKVPVSADDVAVGRRAALWGLDDDASDDNVMDGTDQLYVSYQQGDGDTLVVDCFGDPVESGATRIVSNYFYISNERDLRCVRRTFDTPLTSNTASSMRAHSLITGVNDMQVLYGIDSTPDNGVVEINRYVSAAQVLANGGWSGVRSLRITLDVESESDVVRPANSGDPMEPISKEFEITVMLRNR